MHISLIFSVILGIIIIPILKRFLTDERNGDFDTIGTLYGIKPTGERFEINRYFKEEKDGFVEIDRKEYLTRMEMSKEKRENNEE